MIFILPTDTCYGIAGDLTQVDYEKIYELKGREAAKKLAFLVRDFEMLRKIAIISHEQEDFLKNYPHPFSVLLPPNPNYHFPEFLQISNYQLISVRIAENCIPKNIIPEINFPLFLTSANISGQKESVTYTEAKKNFPNISGFDSGMCDNPPSDIFSFGENNTIKYLRKNSP